MRQILATLCVMASALCAYAQKPLENNQEIKVGKLENGLTYYLMHNEKPKGCADFYIAHNVGALQEEDNQNGLAHFLEHMAFNGTKNYPEKGLLEFLAKEGVRFGYNVNAYTSLGETVYNLSDIPLVRESFVDSVMMVLHDWSCNISCELEALDAERGVISEEWRRTDNLLSRISIAQSNLIYKGSKYTERDVIGKYEIINGFKREEILDFYEKWYRPDLQAMIIIGDFDLNDMESRVKRIFSTIPDGERIPKGDYPVPPMTEPVFENIVDPDVKYQTLKIFHRMPYPSEQVRQTSEYWKQDFEKQIINQVICGRFNNAEKNPACPTEIAVAVTTPSMHHFYVSQFTLSPKEEGQLEGLLRFYETEMASLLKHGFTKDEFDVAKASVWKNNRLDEEVGREDIGNEQIVNLCVEHFLHSTPMVLENDLLDIKRAALNEVKYEEVVKFLPEMIGCKEKIYTYTVGTDKTHLLPSVERMKEIIAEVAEENIGPKFVEYKKMDIIKDVTPGKVTKKKAIKGMDGEVWTLSNGAKVYWMPIDPIKSSTHLTLEARFDTGYKTWIQDEIARSEAASTYISRQFGFGSCSNEDISNDPVCGRVRAFAHTRENSSSLNVHCGRYDVETAFTMFYNFLTRPYFNTQEALDKYIEMNLKNLGREETSKSKFSRERRDVRYGGHPWIVEPDSSSYQSLDLKFIDETFQRNFSNPEEMTVFICTDLDKDIIFPLVEKYIASVQKGETFKKAKQKPILPICKGEVIFDRTYPIVSAPKVDVDYQFLSTIKDNMKNNIAFDILDHIMSERCLNRIREERGGTYTVNFSSDSFGHKGRHQSEITFQTRPEMEEILLKDAQDLMDEMCKSGPTDEEMDAAVKYLIKARGEKKQKNANLITWQMMERKNFISTGIPFEFDFEKIVRSFSAKDIQKLAVKVNNGNRFISIYREQ